MSLKLYIAGASAEIDEIEPRMKRLREAGAEITFDWTATVRHHGSANAGLTHQVRGDAASASLRGAIQADVFWLIAPRAQSIGCWVELGVAYGRGVRVFVSGDDERSIFTALATEVFATHDDAEAHILKWAEAYRGKE